MTDDLEKRLKDLEEKFSKNSGRSRSNGLGWIVGGLFAGGFAYLCNSMVKRPLKTGLVVFGALMGTMIMSEYNWSDRTRQTNNVAILHDSPEYNKKMIERYLYEGQINGNLYREGAEFAEAAGDEIEALRMYYYYRSYVKGLGYPLYAGEVDKPIKKLENILREKNILLPQKSIRLEEEYQNRNKIKEPMATLIVDVLTQANFSVPSSERPISSIGIYVCNNSRYLSISQSKYPEFFKNIDKNGDGDLTLEELGGHKQLEYELGKIIGKNFECDNDFVVKEFLKGRNIDLSNEPEGQSVVNQQETQYDTIKNLEETIEFPEDLEIIPQESPKLNLRQDNSRWYPNTFYAQDYNGKLRENKELRNGLVEVLIPEKELAYPTLTMNITYKDVSVEHKSGFFEQLLTGTGYYFVTQEKIGFIELGISYPITGNYYPIDKEKYSKLYKMIDPNQDGMFASSFLDVYKENFDLVVLEAPEGDVDGIVKEFLRREKENPELSKRK